MEAERAKGTRNDLIVTILVAGLSFTLANVFYAIVRELAPDMGKDDYRETFTGMYDTAMKDIGEGC